MTEVNALRLADVIQSTGRELEQLNAEDIESLEAFRRYLVECCNLVCVDSARREAIQDTIIIQAKRAHREGDIYDRGLKVATYLNTISTFGCTDCSNTECIYRITSG